MSDVPSSTLDPDRLDRLRDLAQLRRDARLLQRLTELFIQDTTVRLATLRDVVLREDDAALRTLAHSIRGGAATFGASEIVALADELEQLPPDWASAQTMPRVDALCSAFEQARLALGVFVGQVEQDLATGG